MASLGSVREQFLGSMFDRLDALAAVGRPSILFCSCAFTMGASLLLGGGTRGGFLSDAILELLAIPPLLFAIASLVELVQKNKHIAHRSHWMLVFCSAIASLPLFQLLPLPPWIWTKLPGREPVLAVFDLLGGQHPWMPISVSPTSTWLSVLSLIPPFAILVGAIQLGYRERRWLSLLVVAFGVISVFLGVVQVGQGPASPLRFFTFTNVDDAVGFFANRNHLAALLYTTLLLAAAWTTDVVAKAGSWNELRRFEPRTILPLTASFTAVVVLILGEVATRSRAGFVLTIVAIAGGIALTFARRRISVKITPRKLMALATVAVIIVLVQVGLYRSLARFTEDPLADARVAFAHNTIQAALAFMPFGSGVGTFVPVYGMFERSSDTFPDVYVNHAHNDILEIWLETGVMGMILLGVFVGWMGFMFPGIWRKTPANASELDGSLVRAATIIIGLLVVHSFVDYPLRTGAMMAIFAFACALLVEPLRLRESELGVVARRMGHRSVAEPAIATDPDAASRSRLPPSISSQPTKVPAVKPGTPGGGRWGEGIEWPEEWRKSNGSKDNKEDD